MMTIGDFGSKSKLTVGSGANQVPEWSYIKLNKPMDEWLTQTPEQKLAQFYSEGTKVFRDGSTMAPGQSVANPTTPQQTQVNTNQVTYSRAPWEGLEIGQNVKEGSNIWSKDQSGNTLRNGSIWMQGQQSAISPTAQPTVTLPDAYRTNDRMQSSPLNIRNGLTMPDLTPRVQPAGNFGQNWSDFLSIANVRQQR